VRPVRERHRILVIRHAGTMQDGMGSHQITRIR
jgi:hypothetical protein